MKRLILICAILVLVQSALVVWTHHSPRGSGSQAGRGPLLKITSAEVNDLLLEDGDGQKLRLHKEKTQWQLPDVASFPADTMRVQGLIDRLAGLQRGWPEAATVEAAKRFKVASDHFKRKLTLRHNSNDLGVVYFGSSPALRKIYVRVDNDQEIQSLAVALHELEVGPDAWIDTRVLHLQAEQVLRVALPGLQLERHKDGLQPTDLAADEEIVKDRRDALVKRLASLAISSVLGKENRPEYGLATPAFRYSLELEGGSRIEYVFGQPSKPGAREAPEEAVEPPWYVLKVSNREELFRVEGWQVEEIRKVKRASLVQKKGKEQAGGEHPQQ